jgi:plastocyanin domain-containing protein
MMMWINLAGLMLIAFIVWWFWLYQPAAGVKADEGPVEIRVKDGVYQPARIEVPVGREVQLKFIREDTSPCAATVIFHGLNVSEELPVKQPKVVSLRIEEPGEYKFTCQMQMYTGTLIARSATAPDPE